MKHIVNVDRLIELLALKGYNKNSFSRASGISDETLRKILRDEVSSPKMAKRISETLEIDLTEVFSLA
ncbi:MAG: helix-turn-helix transcriptional regulator [Gemella haemolysans]|jgi:putative transcriptional regulator|uniref:helix-turn-helix domain-containing protein n=1 Tax=Gemella haemolysans TaxID=1379 RepID=UPI002906002F|nr:helix-turn-helix transcriptional regulator [Gemella haemolysans]MDU4714900.1 helix-turn-helix transcriptional regulator [Gemella haemolysans]